jgi:hypothetical protein
MSVIEDVRNVLQDFLAPELRAISVRLDVLEKKVDANEARAEARHGEVMAGLRQITDYTTVLDRLSKLEARQTVSH